MTEAFFKREADFEDVTALVVEDNNFLRQIVVHVLVELGISDVRYVRSPKEALKDYLHRPAHVVIVECGADIDAACGLLKQLQKSPSWTHGVTGLVALVPQPDLDRVLKVRDSGAEAIIAEPIAPADLASHVRTIVHRHFYPDADDRPAPATGPGKPAAAG